MFKNYLKIALRNLTKQKLYSFINIFGLAIGLGFSLLVILFVNDELTYDHFHEQKDEIYRVYRQPLIPDSPYNLDILTPLPTGEALREQLPEVENFVRLTPFQNLIIRKDGELINQNGIAFADPQVFEIFTLPLIANSLNDPLSKLNSVVITEHISQKYFGDSNSIGKTLSIRVDDEFQKFEVTGVMPNLPSNSSIQFDVLLSIQTVISNFERYARIQDSWQSTGTLTFVKLYKGSNIKGLESKLADFTETYFGQGFEAMRENGTLASASAPMMYNIQPLTDIHLNPEIPGAFTAPSNPQYSFVLSGIALAVLLIACFNFMILSIGKSTRRVKEVGLRKVVGAQRSQIMFQFWGEAIILSFLAFCIGLILAEFSLPLFNELTGKELSILSLGKSYPMLLGLLSLFLLTGLIAGSYPAFVLSGFKPIKSLKGKLNIKGANNFTKSMIVAQFGLTIFLITATFIMVKQLNFLQEKSMGFSGEQVVVIPTNGTDGERTLKLFRNSLENETDILEMSGANVSFSSGLWRRGYRFNDEVRQIAVFRVDPNYIETLQMNLVAGRDFNPLLSSDSTHSIIVNETFLAQHGLNKSAIGQEFPIDWGWMVNPQIIGVVEDFNYQSLQNQIEPVMIYMNPRDPILNIMARIKPDQIPKTISKLRDTWSSLGYEIPFSYSFLDDNMDNLYRTEERWSKIISYSSFLAILIAGLGLFGLAGIIAIQKQKEIGIRKVLGATTSGIAIMLSSGFAKLVLIAILISSPIAWFVMNKWLEEFAYRININGWIFLLSGCLALLIALATVSYQSIKAAIQDPINNLRSE